MKTIITAVVVIVAIVILFIYLYFFIQAQQSQYVHEHFDKLYNQSSEDLRNGKITMLEYCETPVHSEQMCNEYKTLHGIK